MLDMEDNKPKRNRPCENCRAHRRKCAIEPSSTTCARCHKLNLYCIFKFTEKPNSGQRLVPHSKHKKMLSTMEALDEQSQKIKEQLNQLRQEWVIYRKRQKKERSLCKCTDPTTCTHVTALVRQQDSTSWQLAISSDKSSSTALQLQTSVHSISDLLQFINESFHTINTRLSHSPLQESPLLGFMNNLSGETLPLTIKALNAQKIFYTLLITPSPPKNTLMKKQRTIPSQDEFRSVKLHLIELYFNCYGLIFPVLVKPYYYSLAIKDPDSLLSTILVAIVTHSHCVHINLKNYNWSRQQVAERVRKEAVEKLSNVLFEMESTVELCFCLWVLANIHIYVLHIRQARIYSSLCWRMATELKSVYLPILQNPSHFNGVDCIRAETWRRLLYMIRYLEYNMCMVHDECKNMSPVAHHIEIGFPMVLACEKPMPDVLNAVQSFHFVARLTVNAANPSFVSSETELLGLKLITGGLDNVSSILYHRLETGLLDLWKSIPAWMQVGNGPFHYTESQDIKCREPTILRMNGVYYVYWMTLQARLMQYPSTTDLKGASLERMDGDRALIITSITTDTITKIFALLHTLLPCSLEMHWITMCVDVLKLLSISIHPTVKQKADANIEILMGIVQDHLRSITGKNNCKNSPSTPFLNEMKQRLENLYKCK